MASRLCTITALTPDDDYDGDGDDDVDVADIVQVLLLVFFALLLISATFLQGCHYCLRPVVAEC